MKKCWIGLGLFLLVANAPVLAEQPVAVPIQRLSLDTALKAAKTAIDACRKKGVQISAVVIDRGGHTQAALRDVLSPDVSTTIAKRKAYTAMAFVSPTSALSERGAGSLSNVDKFLFAAGAVPIQAGGTLFGAIGVSGAPSGKTDEECAKAGQQAIQADLELM